MKIIKNNFFIYLSHLLIILFCGVLLTNFFSYGDLLYDTQTVFAAALNRRVILLDPGHGGFDPGKVANSKLYEKDINLAITDKLHMLLEQSGAIVYTTRAEDKALGTKKMDDMRKRIYLSQKLEPDVMISIHQNSNESQSAAGAEVYYFTTSDKSKSLAESIQKGLNKFIGFKKKREARPNVNYYMLKKVSVPSVIVECGFLSNPREMKLLQDESYQKKIAWGIYVGIINHFNEQ